MISTTQAYVDRWVEIFQEFADKYNLEFDYLLFNEIDCIEFRFTDPYTRTCHRRMYTFETIRDGRNRIDFIKEETLKALKSY